MQGLSCTKSYILLIICAVTRAVHIEVIPDVGSCSLKLALIRFFSRRGVSKLVISDNFKAFKSIEIKYILRINGSLFNPHGGVVFTNG